jgi:hypothetical protein
LLLAHNADQPHERTVIEDLLVALGGVAVALVPKKTGYAFLSAGSRKRGRIW